jgi:hypothetical protein
MYSLVPESVVTVGLVIILVILLGPPLYSIYEDWSVIRKVKHP